MNTIKQLIEKYCPEGVEYKKLGEMCFYPKERVDVKLLNETNYVSVENLLPNKLGKMDASSIPTNYKFIKFERGDILIGNIRPYLKKIWLSDSEGGTNGDVVVIRKKEDYESVLNDRFLYYILSSDSFFNYDNGYAKGAKMPRGDKKKILEYSLPVPPLPVQREIVRILDNFTSLEAELEAELEARRKQYEYYRDQLLSFKHLSGESTDEVEWKTLGEVGTFKRGKYFQKSDMQDEGIPCIHYGQIYTYYNTYTDKTIKFVSKEVASKSTLIRPQSIIITLTSENIEDVCKPVAWIGNEDVAISGHSVGLETDMDPKYITYYLESSHFFKEKRKKARGAKVIEIKPEELAKIAIPIPPLSTQRRIVSVLDRFESLVNDITTGLPAEIAARHQQYEYYRDQLLSFKRKS